MDINKFLKDLNSNTDSVIELISKYSIDELAFKNQGECSIAEILEHICISDDRTYSLLKGESENISSIKEIYGDEKLKQIVVDYKGGPKITETEIKELKGTISDFLSFEKVFLEQRNLIYYGLKNGEIPISNKTYKHLYLGDMTVTDWLKYILYHTTRHINDIKDSSMKFKN